MSGAPYPQLTDVKRRAVRQGGVALMTVLILLAAISAISIVVLEDISFMIRRAGNGFVRDQGNWHALGAEVLAQETIRAGWRADASRSLPNDAWARAATRFLLPEGAIEASIRDATLCFNVNGVVEREGVGFAAYDAGARQYRALLAALGYDDLERAALADALIDWIDTDQTPRRFGAEDAYYGFLDPAYRTGATLLADLSELRAIKGYDREIYLALAPYLCAQPTTDPSPMNVNMMEERHAPLVVMLADGEITLNAARIVIAARPSAGYGSVGQFWAHDAFADLDPDSDALSQIRLWTRYYDVATTVAHQGAYVELSSLIELRASGDVRVARRAFGARP